MSESDDDVAADDWAAAMDVQGTPDGVTDVDDLIDGVAPAAMKELVAEQGVVDPTGLENILDIPVTLAVEIGSTQVSIRNLLQFNQGSVVELDRLAGEPLNVLVNGTLIAHGEVVVVNEKFGIRLTDVVSAHERVRKLS
jgi:flagellar motor switch protein FliN/FliY